MAYIGHRGRAYMYVYLGMFEAYLIGWHLFRVVKA